MSYVIGVDGGTESIRAGVYSSDGTLVASSATPYSTQYPKPGWAEQDPEDWWAGLGAAVKAVVAKSGVPVSEIKGFGMDTTCCSVVALDASGNALRPCLLWMDMRPCLLWMDMRSGAECAPAVLATGDAALRVNSAGQGPVSAEWMIPKALWLKRNEPDTYAAAKYVCEYQDFMNLRLTGRMVASINNASIRWHYCSKRGWPTSLLAALDLSDLMEKWPQEMLELGAVIGGLTRDAAAHLGLPEGLPVAQGGADAFVGILGLGVVNPGEMALLTGSSHLHLGLVDREISGGGMWGSYSDAVLHGLYVVEGGQTSTGSVAAWFRKIVGGDSVSYQELDAEAAAVPPGCEGLLCLDHFQGNRTPFTDPHSRGAFSGLSLGHTRGHMFRAVLEGVSMGTELVLEAMRKAGYQPTSIAVAGGAARSPLWLQLHADVCGVPLHITKGGTDACLLGSAMLAAVGAGLYDSIPGAAAAMVKIERTILPDKNAHAAYGPVIAHYRRLYTSLKPLFHSQAGGSAGAAKGGGGGGVTLGDKLGKPLAAVRARGDALRTAADVRGIVDASILAADFADFGGEAERALEAGAQWCHVDIVDGHFAKILTFGPPVVRSLRRRLPQLFIDVHLAVENPGEYIAQLAAAGASQVLFHVEACRSADAGHPSPTYCIDTVAALAREIRAAGMRAGVVLNPETPAAVIAPLLSPGAVQLDCVDCLAVQPGFGGQPFDKSVLQKVAELREMCPTLDIQVDGGVNLKTAAACVQAGANVLTAGTCIFGAEDCAAAVGALRQALAARWTLQ
ncbi:hypothetical protein JKP88DRAFT_258094 [Tribonema minus]|uniref:Glycerol kinase n=1 Tax=Tribonema minus TaxID=303371 RepID=A0A835YTS4_9STRA|nr:hypothetical protein JKP88DRAFT_258094 [Tribonema minus]